MTTATTNRDVELVRRWAEFYRARGLNPLPSRSDAKRPFIRYADRWESQVPAGEFDRHSPRSMQIMTGRFWGLLVIDLDGEQARAKWREWTSARRNPRTWITHSGGRGWHVWYAVPREGPALPKSTLWRPDPSQPRVKGEPAIERLGDHSLVMAPPSLHPNGRRYRFLDKPHSPATLPMPAACPEWLLRLPNVDGRPVLPKPPMPTAPRRPRVATTRRFNRSDVLDAIPDKVALARSWGLRLTGRRYPSGLWQCHAIDRDDRNPSAAIHERTGVYRDYGSGLRLSLFDLAVARGVYADWQDALNDLGASHEG